jgi:glucosamine-6-phosphate deaminase
MQIISVETAEDVAVDVARRIVDTLRQKPGTRFCLPSGMTPVPAFSRIAAAVRGARASFSRAEVFLLDEFGGVAPDAKGRCDVMLRRTLIDAIDLPADRYHRPEPEAVDVDEMCRCYEAAVYGRLDLTLLGLGTNGHIGMNEPGSARDSPTRRVDLAPETIGASARYFDEGPLPTWGVTIGLRSLLASRTVYLVATGASKAAIVRAVMQEPVSTKRPASLLRDHPDAWLFVDAAAASSLA